jgi:hypothetical protein
MTLYIDHRDFLTYAEGREQASRERAEAINAIWTGLLAWVSRRLAAVAGPLSEPQQPDVEVALEFHPWARGELDQEFTHHRHLQIDARRPG